MKVEIRQQDCVVTITAPLDVVKVLATVLIDVDLEGISTKSLSGKELCSDIRMLGMEIRDAIKEETP